MASTRALCRTEGAALPRQRGAVSKPTGLGMVSYSYFNFQLLQTVAKGFNRLQPMDSAVPASAPVADCCNLLQTRGKGVACHTLQPMRSIVFSRSLDTAR
jgi:hypothetical protein